MESGFWEDEARLSAADACAYYDYFATLLLTPIEVPGTAYLADLRKRSAMLFDDADAQTRLLFAFLSQADAEDAQRALAVDRTKLFRGVDPEGLLPPYESFWGSKGESGLAATLRAYRAAGFEPSQTNRERQDYLGVELAFLATLAQAEADAAAHGAPDAKASDLRAVRRTFLNDHIIPWLPTYCAAALPYARTPYFQTLLPLLSVLFSA